MSAKTELLERLQYVDKAVSLPELIDVGIAPSEHNGVANLLRKGLGIVMFNILEDFIKKRSLEALNLISASTISFNDLPSKLQESAISGALSSLNYHVRILKKENPNDYLRIIQEESKKIGSTLGNPFEISKYSLVSSGSNITSGEIAEFLKAFGIAEPWIKLKDISDRIGGGIPDLATAYNLAEQRRHNSAHAAAFNYNYTWLFNLRSELLAIAASIDILISARCRQVKLKPTIKMDTHDLNLALNLRFLEIRGSVYAETKTINGRSIKNWTNSITAISHHQQKVENRNEFLIILNSSKRIIDWLT